MIKKTLFIFLLVGLTALAGCHTGGRSSVRADYYGSYGYGGRYAPYYYYDPFYPRYFYDPYPSFFFSSSFFYGYPYYFYPHSFIIIDRGTAIRPGSRSLRGFRRSPGFSDGTTNRAPSGRSGGSSGGGSRGGRSLR